MTHETAFRSAEVFDHFRTADEIFGLPRKGGQPKWANEAFHDAAYQGDPELYAIHAVADGVQGWQRVRVLFQLLRRSRAGFSMEMRETLERVTIYLLTTLPADRVLTVFLALRRVRANHKHTQKAILKYLLDHPCMEDMAVRRRPALVDSLEHALGKNTARACARMILTEQKDGNYLRRNLLRFAEDPNRARTLIRLLYEGAGHSVTQKPLYAKRHEDYLQTARKSGVKRPKTITATNRGDIAATLVHLYRGGTSPELSEALDRYVQEMTVGFPRFEGKMALILDASESTRGYGEREYACISQSVALKLVLERCCPRLKVFQVGGVGYPPIPRGNTDLATALLDALEGAPELVAIVSDGYENVVGGDLAAITSALPGAGIHAPVVFCHSKFTEKDDQAMRKPAPSLPSVEFWHQEDFAELAMRLFGMAGTDGGTAIFRRHLLEKLERFEKEKRPWLNLN